MMADRAQASDKGMADRAQESYKGMAHRAQASYCTTRQFAKRDRDYVKHCGPTAITNLVLTLRPDLAEDPGRVFDAVVATGRRLGIYWNLKATKHIGGTSDALAGLYIRQALAHFGITARVRFAGPATAARVRAALAEGRIVYLAMHFHPKYHNHHLLLYGVGRYGLRAADGWQAKPVWLSDRDLRGAVFFTIAEV